VHLVEAGDGDGHSGGSGGCFRPSAAARAEQVLLQVRRPFSASRSAAAPVDPEGFKPAAVRREDHEVFEMLFEYHLQTVSTVQTSLDLLRSEMVNGEQYHLTRLSMSRNKILTTTLMFNVVSMCTAIGSYLGSVFGMNLTSGLETNPNLFNFIAIFSAAFIVFGTMAIFVYMRWAGVLNSEVT